MAREKSAKFAKVENKRGRHGQTGKLFRLTKRHEDTEGGVWA